MTTLPTQPFKKVLVTGGCGFIGSHIAEALVNSGRQVRIVDDLSTGYLRNIEGLDVELLEGDVSDPQIAQAAVDGVSNVYHLAARPSVPFSIAHPKQAHQANLQSTLSLIAAAEASEVKSIVFSSSSAVYGDEPTLPKRENCTLAPMSPYAEHKLASEHAFAASSVSAVALRYFNVFGPKQDPSSPYSGVISLFSKWAAEGTPASVFGDGLQTRDFVYVDDVVSANLHATQFALDDNDFDVFNVASGTAITVLELWQQICEICKLDESPVTHQPSREGDIRDSVADISRAQEMLGYRVSTDLEHGLRECLQSI
jgi:UDP-glucose 4-epimerase